MTQRDQFIAIFMAQSLADTIGFETGLDFDILYAALLNCYEHGAILADALTEQMRRDKKAELSDEQFSVMAERFREVARKWRMGEL